MEDYFAAKASLFTPEHAPPGRGLRRRRVGRAAGPRGHGAGRHGRVAPRIAGELALCAIGDWPTSFTLSGPAGRGRPPVPTCRATSTSPTPRWPPSALLRARPRRSTGSREALRQRAARPRADGGRHRHASRRGPRPALRRRLRAHPRRRRGRPARPAADDAGTAGRRPRRRRRPRPRQAAGRWAPPRGPVADVVVVTDDNPRSEDPAGIRAAVLAGASVGRGRGGRPDHGVATSPSARSGPAGARRSPRPCSWPGAPDAPRTTPSLVARQGARDRPGDRRRRAPVRRPGRARRGALDGLVCRPEATA